MNMQQICVLVQENKDVSHFAFLVFLCMLLYIVLCVCVCVCVYVQYVCICDTMC